MNNYSLPQFQTRTYATQERGSDLHAPRQLEMTPRDYNNSESEDEIVVEGRFLSEENSRVVYLIEGPLEQRELTGTLRVLSGREFQELSCGCRVPTCAVDGAKCAFIGAAALSGALCASAGVPGGVLAGIKVVKALSITTLSSCIPMAGAAGAATLGCTAGCCPFATACVCKLGYDYHQHRRAIANAEIASNTPVGSDGSDSDIAAPPTMEMV